MLDTELFGAGLAEIVREQVEMSTKALTEEVAALRRELAERPAVLTVAAVQRMISETVGSLPPPNVGLTDEQMAGVSLLAEETARATAEMVTAEKTAALPVPKDGEPGRDADPELIREMVAAAVAELPPPRDGIDGKDIDPDAIDLMIAQAVAKLPAPKDGASVTVDDVAPMIAEAVEKAVANIPVAKDGVGLAGAVIGRDGNLILTLTDGQARDLGLIVGRDGTPGERGEPGRDGFSLTAFDTELSQDGRTLTLSFEDESLKVTHELELGGMIYREVFKDGQIYAKGDTVTWGGSLYIANRKTGEKPDGSKDWALAARKGRDGKDAK